MDTERRGRRPGPSGTREAILEAARRLFSESGYDRASMRQVARDAGVDPALVTHYFDSKPRLFAEVAELPFSGPDVLPRLLAGGADSAGAALAHFAVGLLESDAGRARIVSVVRAATAEPAAAEMIR